MLIISLLAISVTSLKAMQIEQKGLNKPGTFQQHMEEIRQFMAVNPKPAPVMPLNFGQMSPSTITEDSVQRPVRKNPLAEYLKTERLAPYEYTALENASHNEQHQSSEPTLPIISESDIIDSKNPIKSTFVYNPHLATKKGPKTSYDNDLSAKTAKKMVQIFDMKLSETTAAYNKKHHANKSSKVKAPTYKKTLLFDDQKQALEKKYAEKKVILEQQMVKEKKAMEILAEEEKALLEARETSLKNIIDNQVRSFQIWKLPDMQTFSQDQLNSEKSKQAIKTKKPSLQRKYGEMKLVFEKRKKAKRSNPENQK